MLGWATVQSNQGWLFEEKKGFWYGGRLWISAIYKSVRTSLEVEVDTHPSKYIGAVMSEARGFGGQWGFNLHFFKKPPLKQNQKVAATSLSFSSSPRKGKMATGQSIRCHICGHQCLLMRWWLRGHWQLPRRWDNGWDCATNFHHHAAQKYIAMHWYRVDNWQNVQIVLRKCKVFFQHELLSLLSCHMVTGSL